MQGYRTIVVHLADERRAARLVATAVSVASMNEAHLIGLFVMPTEPPSPLFAGTAGRALIDIGRKAFAERGKRLRRIFEEQTAAAAVKTEWRVVKPGRKPILEAVMAHARSADLIVASQRDYDWEDTAIAEYPDEFVLGSGRPVLLVPNAWRPGDFPGRVLVAWNERREAARAVFDALPLLKAAREVRVLWINPESEAIDRGDLPTAEIAATLARHGVKVTADQTRSPDLTVGTELLNRAFDHSADLLVMGAYGHARVREVLFGGATREILRHMTLPVLMSH